MGALAFSAPAGIHATDVYAAFNLPAPPEIDEFSALQVAKRAAVLGLTAQSPTDAWNEAAKLGGRYPDVHVRPMNRVVFGGSTASALNQLLVRTDVSYVNVASLTIVVDQPVEIRRNGIVLDPGCAQLMAHNPQPYMLRIENASGVTIMHGAFVSGDSAILVNTPEDGVVKDVQISNFTGDGIVVTDWLLRASFFTGEQNAVSWSAMKRLTPVTQI